MMRKCTGARGRTSWNARMCSSSCNFFAGISPRTILQNTQLGSVVMFSRRLLIEPRNAFAPMQLRQHVAGPQAVAREEDHAVEPQVRGLAHEVEPVAALGGEQGLGGFFADLLEDRVLVIR